MTRERGSVWTWVARRLATARDIPIVLDRRQAERRQQLQPPDEERRLTDRRRPESSDLGEVGGFLEAGIHLRGVLQFSGALRVDGHFEGEQVRGETLVIGEHGLVNAEIRVEILQVSGQVLGNVTAKRWVELLESSTMTGTIRTPRLTIWKGAVFNGTCDMPAAQSPESEVLSRLA
jgi:cytoskeletal protein CcmA (bactofilin family)